MKRKGLPPQVPEGTKVIASADEYRQYFDHYGAASVRKIPGDRGPFGPAAGYVFLDDDGDIVAFAWPEARPRRSRPQFHKDARTGELLGHAQKGNQMHYVRQRGKHLVARCDPRRSVTPQPISVPLAIQGIGGCKRCGVTLPDESEPRQNPGPSEAAIARAVNIYEGFHAYDSDETGMLDIEIPETVLYGGPCTYVTYASDKWESRSFDYIHAIESQPRVFCGIVGAGGGRRRRVPAKIRKTEVVAQLGLRALGFGFIDQNGDEVEAKLARGTRWFWSPRGKALLAVEKKRRLVAIVWGGDLDVEPRGIVG